MSLSIGDMFKGEDEEEDSSESDSQMSSSKSDNEPLAKKAKTTKYLIAKLLQHLWIFFSTKDRH